MHVELRVEARDDLTDSGELPPGVRRASLQETFKRFAVGHPQRIAVGERLERIYHLATATGHVERTRRFAGRLCFTLHLQPGNLELKHAR